MLLDEIGRAHEERHGRFAFLSRLLQNARFLRAHSEARFGQRGNV